MKRKTRSEDKAAVDRNRLQERLASLIEREKRLQRMRMIRKLREYELQQVLQLKDGELKILMQMTDEAAAGTSHRPE